MESITTTSASRIHSTSSPASPAVSAQRVIALDALRGLAVLGMILVVSPGSWGHRLPMLNHAAWHGYTLADLVFPAFLFAVGVAIALAFPSDRAFGPGAARIGRRTLSLMGLGLLLNLLPNFDFANFRVPGVLQRIALCYCFAAMFCLISARLIDRTRFLDVTRVIVAAVILLVGWALVLSFTSAPGFPQGDVSQAGTLAAWVDRQVITQAHMWPYGTNTAGEVVFDPEGILSTLPATASVLIGTACGHLLGRAPSTRQLKRGIAAGTALVLIGYLLSPLVVINKWIWTPSFALVSSGWALIAYCILHTTLQVRGAQFALKPALILGSNAILAFVLCELFGKVAGTSIAGTTPQNFAFQTLLAIVNEPWTASFLCALGVAGIIIMIVWPLHCRGIHIRL